MNNIFNKIETFCTITVNCERFDNFFSCWIKEVSERPNIKELCDLPFLNGKSVPLEVSDEESEEEDEGLNLFFLLFSLDHQIFLFEKWYKIPAILTIQKSRNSIPAKFYTFKEFLLIRILLNIKLISFKRLLW